MFLECITTVTIKNDQGRNHLLGSTTKMIKWIHWINFALNDLFWLYVRQEQATIIQVKDIMQDKHKYGESV